MKKQKLDLDTQSISGMAGEPMEIPIFLKGGKEIAFAMWINEATEADKKRLEKLNNILGENNHASAVSWCI